MWCKAIGLTRWLKSQKALTCCPAPPSLRPRGPPQGAHLDRRRGTAGDRDSGRDWHVVVDGVAPGAAQTRPEFGPGLEPSIWAGRYVDGRPRIRGRLSSQREVHKSDRRDRG